jgi:hypothetical protein
MSFMKLCVVGWYSGYEFSKKKMVKFALYEYGRSVINKNKKYWFYNPKQVYLDYIKLFIFPLINHVYMKSVSFPL